MEEQSGPLWPSKPFNERKWSRQRQRKSKIILRLVVVVYGKLWALKKVIDGVVFISKQTLRESQRCACGKYSENWPIRHYPPYKYEFD